ncbi:hypothetical protein D3C87_2042350 [compost metagenome]
MAAGELAERCAAVETGDEEFVGPEIILRLAADRNAQHLEHCPVKPPAGRQVLHDEPDMVDQAAAVEFVGFHG